MYENPGGPRPPCPPLPTPMAAILLSFIVKLMFPSAADASLVYINACVNVE